MAAAPEEWDLEKIHDEQISPLMDKIIEICAKHRIPLVASFCYGAQADGGRDMCTTYTTWGRDVTSYGVAAHAITVGSTSMTPKVVMAPPGGKGDA